MSLDLGAELLAVREDVGHRRRPVRIGASSACPHVGQLQRGHPVGRTRKKLSSSLSSTEEEPVRHLARDW